MSFDDLARLVTFAPLDVDHERSGKQATSQFEVNWRRTVQLLARELEAIDARDVVMQLDIGEHHLRRDGLIRADARLQYEGVVLSIGDSRHGPLRYMCDQFTERGRWGEDSPLWQHNVRAIALGLEALRKVDRYGITQSGEQYRGFRALPEGSGAIASGMTLTDAYAIVEQWSGYTVDGSVDAETVAGIVKKAKAAAHPDHNGGNRAGWDEVEQAADVIARTRSAHT